MRVSWAVWAPRKTLLLGIMAVQCGINFNVGQIPAPFSFFVTSGQRSLDQKTCIARQHPNWPTGPLTQYIGRLTACSDATNRPPCGVLQPFGGNWVFGGVEVNILWFLGAVIACLVAYLALWPVSVRPVSWEVTENAGYVGDFTENHRLAALDMIDLDGRVGPEDADVGPDGKIYLATHDGEILRIGKDGDVTSFAQTQGRPLGLEFAARTCVRCSIFFFFYK